MPSAYKPGRQISQVRDSSVPAAVPSGQGPQKDKPGFAVRLPIGQTLHAVEPTIALYKPALHAAQLVNGNSLALVSLDDEKPAGHDKHCADL